MLKTSARTNEAHVLIPLTEYETVHELVEDEST